jgi:hypothetical protein
MEEATAAGSVKQDSLGHGKLLHNCGAITNALLLFSPGIETEKERV